MKVLDSYREQVALYIKQIKKKSIAPPPQTYFGTAFSSAEGFSRGESILTEGFACRPNKLARSRSAGRLYCVPNFQHVLVARAYEYFV